MMSPMDNLGWINSPKIITIFLFSIKKLNKNIFSWSDKKLNIKKNYIFIILK
jgi:beta-mannanase